jgi:hypothetical protein
VGINGSVVALDIDTRFVEQLGHPNLEVRKQDVSHEGVVERNEYDLVHARMVLEHVPGREQALEHMVAALKPGGWIVLEELDHVTLLPDPAVGAQKQVIWHKFRDAYRKLMDKRGGDLDYGRRLFGLLTGHDLTNVSVQGHATLDKGGAGSSLGFHQARAELVATGAIDDAEMGILLQMLDDPDFAYISPLMMVASAQRPPVYPAC